MMEAGAGVMDGGLAAKDGPAEPGFVHLHVHSHNSFLSSTIKIADLVKRAKAENMPAVALTDTNNVFGAIEFYFACKDAGIKPVLSPEAMSSAN